MQTPAKIKVYEQVLDEIRNYIEKHRLSPGDKLPSERELAVQLDAGRSSIREALRAIELLGLIETRRGEGTFLRVYRPYHTVELLSTFILQDPRTRDDIVNTKQIMEKEAAKLAAGNITPVLIRNLKTVLSATDFQEKQRHYHFFLIIFQHTDNLLLQKIWQLLEDFAYTINEISYNNSFYNELLESFSKKELERIDHLFHDLYRYGSST
ncbi:FadR/GntR family transcriptional regulator [Sediminibacillus massiliensis]|uniref:FadR/GntR family transcriptional regulator n=1 Tax=Sediminibacillus massiliensis TaxID=1926277 RepID=UPI0009888973|nr:GntR family transcriptional regulator [Sediminibacillus massiliensis]